MAEVGDGSTANLTLGRARSLLEADYSCLLNPRIRAGRFDRYRGCRNRTRGRRCRQSAGRLASRGGTSRARGARGSYRSVGHSGAGCSASTFKGLSKPRCPAVAGGSYLDIPSRGAGPLCRAAEARTPSPLLKTHLLWLTALALATGLAWAFSPSQAVAPVSVLHAPG